jgi:hypothetical protein
MQYWEIIADKLNKAGWSLVLKCGYPVRKVTEKQVEMFEESLIHI